MFDEFVFDLCFGENEFSTFCYARTQTTKTNTKKKGKTK